MSGATGRREVAHRLFATEYEDASLEYAESDEERAPNYVVTPTGARVNRAFIVGVLTSVEQVNEDTVRARIADPTGAFVVYAGQYQPDELAALQSMESPAFVAITGKANTFQPDGSDRVLTSIRPESVTEVDAETRDRWAVTAAEHTLGRIETAAEALAREERGDELVAALRRDGVDPSLAEGVARAIEHYDTTADYLGALREVALQAVEVVAGERSEAESLDVEPDASTGTYAAGDLQDSAPDAAAAVTDVAGPIEDVEIDVEDADADAEGADEVDETADETAADETGADEPADETTAGGTPTSASEETGTSTTDEAETPSSDESAEPASEETTAASEETSEAETAPASAETAEPNAESSEAQDASSARDADVGGDVDEVADADDDADADEQLDADDGDDDLDPEDLEDVVDDEERERIEEEYGVGFESGAEVDEPGEAGIDAPDEAAADEGDGAADAADDAGETADADAATETDAAEDADDTAASESDDASDADEDAGDEGDAGDADLEAALLDQMADMDGEDGAERAALVDAVAADTGADESAVEDAIEDALMSGKCYEPSEGVYKPI